MTDHSPMDQSTNPQPMPVIPPLEDVEMQLSTSDATIEGVAPASITETVAEVAATAESPGTVAQGTAPKKVFSLFLSPEERKLKMGREVAAAREAAASKAATLEGSKRGRKIKKAVHNIFAPGTTTATVSATAASTTSDTNDSVNGSGKPAVKLSAHVPGIGDPSRAPHPFFAETSKGARAAAQIAVDEQEGKFASRYRWSTAREPAPFPSSRFQYHSPVTADRLHNIVGEMCDLLAPSLPTGQCESSKRAHKEFGWYALRTLGSGNDDVAASLGSGSGSGSGSEPGQQHMSSSSETRIGRLEPIWSTARSGTSRHIQGDRDVASQHSRFPRADTFTSCKRFTEALVASSGPPLLLSGQKKENPATEQQQNSSRIEGKPGDLWIEKYRPRSGIDVLGNRYSTEYLTQWLKHLEVSAWSLGPDDPHHPSNTNNNSSKRSISGVGRPKKRTRRSKARWDDLDDFIVDDDFDDNFYGSDGGRGSEAFAPQPNLSPFARFEPGNYRIHEAEGAGNVKKLEAKLDIRSNIILLSGPSGSGKTAAVYACAEESGYEVFEVSPASKRAGRDVLALVGEMAENHHVHVVSNGTGNNSTNSSTPNTPVSSTSVDGECPSKRSTESVASTPHPTTADKPQKPSVYNLFFKKYKPKRLEEDQVPEEPVSVPEPALEPTPEPEPELELERAMLQTDITSKGGEEEARTDNNNNERSTSLDEEENIEIVDETPLALHDDSLADYLSLLATTNPRQSLILLEEVDILFEDDKGFWGSIATLAAKSKRPIVMTCNDPLLIPPGILTIQEHLKFERPSSSELFRYLECVCRMEGYVYTPGTLEGLIKEGQHDIRRILMQLQWTACAPSKEDSPKDQKTTPQTPEIKGSGGRKGPQRLFRITSKGVQSASSPGSTHAAEYRSLAAPTAKPRSQPLSEEQIQERLNGLVKLASDLSLVDSSLGMHGNRAFQHFENDQEKPLKDDEQGVRFVFKEPLGHDHLLWDLEIAALVEDGARTIAYPRAADSEVAQRSTVASIPERASICANDVTDYYTFIPSELSRYVSQVAPSLEHILTVQNLYHSQSEVFSVYTSALRDMVLADDINGTIPSGRRSMRSNGGRPRRHLPLHQAECSALLMTAFDTRDTGLDPQ